MPDFTYLVAFGVLFTLALITSVVTIVFKKKENGLALASIILSCLFCWWIIQGATHALAGVNQIALSAGANFTLIVSALFALFSVPFVWREMIIKPLEHPAAWTLILVILSILLLNQFLFRSPIALLMPSFLVSSLIVVDFVAQARELLKSNLSIQRELDLKRIAIGLDLATGLANKLAFTERVEKWLFVHPEERLNIVVFKFTRFGELNALIGHNNADLVKIQLITRLKSRLSTNPDVLSLSDDQDIAPFATVGGVDFAVVVKADKQNYATERFIELLKTTIKEPIVVDATAVDVGIEFGVASYPSQGQAVDYLIENAYVAMNLAQNTEDSIYFDQKQQAQLLINRSTIGQLKEDMRHNRFLLYVQPQIALHSKQVIGGELLIRWSRQDKGIVPAAEFIKLAEQSGIIYQLNLWAIEAAIKTLSDLKKEGLPQTLSVNVSNRELFQSQLVESVITLLEKHVVDPSKLVVEMKESAFAINLHKALKVARLFQQAGVKVAIDDFGKDRTAIGTFNYFTPHYLKVDCRHLASGKVGDNVNTYTNAIIGMAKTLQIPVIAQGVELEATEAQLKSLDCDAAQGFLYSKPFELQGLSVWIEQWRRTKLL